jgi:hypothetical protein
MGYHPLTTLILRCSHCGNVDWNRTPELEGTLKWLINRRKPCTTSEIAEGLRITLGLCSHRMSALVTVGMVKAVYVGHPGGQGGRLRVFTPLVDLSVFDRPYEVTKSYVKPKRKRA